jgi:hypothetical protein
MYGKRTVGTVKFLLFRGMLATVLYGCVHPAILGIRCENSDKTLCQTLDYGTEGFWFESRWVY